VRDAFVTRGIARFKIPDYLAEVAELPRTAVGKIDKKALLRHFEKGSSMTEGTLPPLSINGVHHLAHVTWRPEETVAFYRDALGLPLVHAVSATGWLSDDFPDFLHFFFALGKGNHIAFFYYFDTPEDAAADALMRKSRHIAFDVETAEEMHAWRQRLKAHGIPVTPPLTHELVESIYFEDPNGIQLEIARPLRAFTEVDARDADLTVRALLDVVKGEKPSLHAVWRRKAELLRERLGAVTR
jgi:catechol 2,3-dioxygenase-like lactoylglutathione lyase family enzyme